MSRAVLAACAIVLAGCAANRPQVAIHESSTEGPPATAPTPTSSHGLRMLDWIDDHGLWIIGAGLLVVLATHHGGDHNSHHGATECGPGTGLTCPPMPPVCSTATVNGICMN